MIYLSIALFLMSGLTFACAFVVMKRQHKKMKEEIENIKNDVIVTEEERAEWVQKEYYHLKSEVADLERAKPIRVFHIFMIGVSSFFLFFAFFWYVFYHSLPKFTKYSIYAVSVLYAVTFSLTHFLIRDAPLRKARRRVHEYELSHLQQDPFTNAIKTSYTYLDQYYAQTKKQARNGFIITVVVAVLGAILIFMGVWFMMFSKGSNDNITPAYITCASGAITEFISAVFFALYNKTVTSMNSYHDKLVLSQNIAFALRIAGEMEGMGNKNKAKLAIINELVKDVNAQMMKGDADTDEPPKKDKPSDSDTPSQ